MQYNDKWTIDDRLGFDVYRETLVDVIWDADTPITVGLFGSWGSGKTSLMRMVRERLDPRPQPLNPISVATVWFDAWKYDKDEVLWRALLMHTLEALRPQELNDTYEFTDTEKEISRDLDDLQASLYRDVDREETGSVEIDWREAAKGTFKLGLSMLPMLPKLMEAGETLNKLFDGAKAKDATGGAQTAVNHLVDTFKRERITIHRDHVEFLDQFQTHFQDIVNRRIPEDGRLVVFIDDLDRCLPEKAIEILEAVKLFLEVERCVYVVGVDHRVIEQGIKVKYKSLGLDESKGELPIQGDEYLEKIVQIPFHLPPILNKKIKDFTAERLSEAFDTPVAAVFANGLEPVPRKIKRVLNIFHLLWTLAKKQGMTPDTQKENVTPLLPDLLAKIIVIQHRSRDLLFKDIQTYEGLLSDLETYFEAHPEDPRDESPDDPPPEAATVEDEDVQGQADLRPAEPRKGTLLAKYAGERWLKKMFLTKDSSQFREIERLLDYITFTATVAEQPTAQPAAPVDDRIWADLTSNDPTKIEQALKDMAAQEKPVYRKRLLDTLEGKIEANTDERIAAGNALGMIGDPRFAADQEPEMISIPEGSFTMGDDQGEDREKPQRTVQLSAYEIAKYPVTNSQYQAFVKDTKHDAPGHWNKGRCPDGQENHPVTYVSWNDAKAYADWLSKKIGKSYALPTEAQWERAARGDQDTRKQPWDGELDPDRANIRESGIGGTTPVGAYPGGKSPGGVLDMAGNVWELCADWYDEDYYRQGEDDDPQGPDKGDYHVLRGGSYYSEADFSGCSSRLRDLLVIRLDFGFRLSRTP